MAQNMIRGRKGGGGGGHTPVESPDSIQSIARAKMLFALGEGEFAGGLDGTNIFADGTPALNADGSENFPGFRWEFRPGTQAQDYIQGIPAVENEITVGTELKSGTPWVRSVSNLQLSAVRLRFGWPMLQKQEDNGDVNGYRIEYVIDVATDGGSYQEMLTAAIDDKTTSLYERSHRINLPKATTGWQVRVRRLTPNANSARIADRMNIEALTEIIDAKLRYPNTALLYVEFDSKQFPNIPKISCAPRGRVIRVPDNYDPETRSYTGVWTGGFKWAYSDNPAWVFYDIILADRFGLGDRIDSTQISESELYRIAQYCDQPVPDGRGGDGMEPRFTCNVYIQSREDAWTVLSDLAGIFRGMTYWGQNQMVALADMPRDMDFTYTRANVIDGKFTYSSASERTRYSTAMVSWSDPANHFADAIEAVFDSDLVRRYDVNQTELTAIGCTRQSEANRRGRWALLTNSKDRTVSFSVGLDGMIPMPGHIVGVADQMVAGRVIGADGATAIHTLKAGVRVNGVFYNAGMSIAVLAETGKPVITRIGFNANQFVLMSGSGDTQYSPFAVVNGQVFISDAFIQDGSINNAKIGNYIQSNDYVAGKIGWQLNKAGVFEINGSNSRGRSRFTGDSWVMTDSNNINRIEIAL